MGCSGGMTGFVSTREVQRSFMKSRILLVFSALTMSIVAQAQSQSGTHKDVVDHIKREVRHELLMLPYLGVFDNLAFSVDGYDVTLVGKVTRPLLKSDAANAVKRIEGVEHVN